MSKRRSQNNAPPPPQSISVGLSELQRLHDMGRLREAIEAADAELKCVTEPEDVAHTRLYRGMAVFEVGSASEGIALLRQAMLEAEPASLQLQFATSSAVLTRESQFQTSSEMVTILSRVRQLAARLGSPTSIAGLHLAVARLEAYRGNCFDSRRHLEIARTAAARAHRPSLTAAIDLVDASLEHIAGNLVRATRSAKSCFESSAMNNLGILRAGASTNLGLFALCRKDLTRAHDYLNHAEERSQQLSFIKLAALDNMAQVALFEGDLDKCSKYLDACAAVIASQEVPARSWYDLAHQVTRCAVLAQFGDWEGVIDIARTADPELERRQFRSLRTALLCASARAQARPWRAYCGSSP